MAIFCKSKNVISILRDNLDFEIINISNDHKATRLDLSVLSYSL